MKYLVNIKTNGTEDALQKFYKVINHLDHNIHYLLLCKFEGRKYSIIIDCFDWDGFIRSLDQLDCVIRYESHPILDSIGIEVKNDITD